MRKLKTSQLLAGVFLVSLITCIPLSCATSSESIASSQRKSLMMQDKSEYSRNQRNFKGTKAHKKQLRRTKKYKKRRMRR